MPHECGVPSAAGSQFKDLISRLKLQKVEHSKHERGLRDGGRDVLVVVAKQNYWPVRVERSQVFGQIIWIHYMPFLGEPFAIAFDKAVPGIREVRLHGRFADWRLLVEFLRLLQKLLLVFLDVVHCVCPATLVRTFHFRIGSAPQFFAGRSRETSRTGTGCPSLDWSGSAYGSRAIVPGVFGPSLRWLFGSGRCLPARRRCGRRFVAGGFLRRFRLRG